MRVVVADDEPRAREILKYYLSKFGNELELVGEAGTGSEAVELVRRLRPDVVFLDVRMPDLNGVEVAQLLRALPHPPRVVFVTAYEEHAVAAFETEAVDYLVKPVTAARVAQTVERLRRNLPQTPSPGPKPWSSRAARLSVEVPAGPRVHRTMFLDPRTILVVEAQGKSAVVRTARDEILVSSSLADLESALLPSRFMRVHRSYVVNLDAVREVYADGRTYALKVDGRPEAIPISRDRLDLLRKALNLRE
ncbi:MAG: LytTR family DNA-binding domain-containing protein [Bacillota bacterium]|nr:LytTR family DNA-binding domain-containing protein [Bacillota bacterium]